MRQPNDEEGARASDVSRIFGLGLGIPAPPSLFMRFNRCNQLEEWRELALWAGKDMRTLALY